MNNILFVDIDGVLRDLTTLVFGFEPPDWNYSKNGENLIKILKQHPEYNINAKPYPYVNIINKMKYINILTSTLHPDETKQWLNKYIHIDINLYIVSNIQKKESFINNWEQQTSQKCYLIDDYPYFTTIKRLILIDRNYNKNSFCLFRIKHPLQLEKLLINLGFIN